jgi:hypothetical protein
MTLVNMKNTFNNVFELLFLKTCVMPSNLWWTLPLLSNCFMALIFLFTISMGDMWGGHHYYQQSSSPGRCSSCFGHFVLMCSLSTSLSDTNSTSFFSSCLFWRVLRG